jgi:hypothetical protein
MMLNIHLSRSVGRRHCLTMDMGHNLSLPSLEANESMHVRINFLGAPGIFLFEYLDLPSDTRARIRQYCSPTFRFRVFATSFS